MNTYLMGIDIGTSGCKIAVFQRNGEPVASVTKSYSLSHPKEGWAEQNPDLWWEAVVEGVKEIFEKKTIAKEEIVGIGVDGQSWSAIAVDKEGNVLCDTPIWMDTRAASICKEIEESLGEDTIFSCAKNPMKATYTTGKVLWYKKYLPKVYEKADKILQSNSYIVYRLTGKMTQDLSQGYGWHCFDMEKGEWDIELCEKMGIRPQLLPPIYPCHHVVGKVTKEVAKITGLLEGTPVVAGGLDAACGTLGAGVIHDGETQEQGGQAGGMSICMDKALGHKQLILGFHVVPNTWLLQGGTTGGGGVLRWFKEEFGDWETYQAKNAGESAFDLLCKRGEEIKAGSEGLIFLPYMSGERSPIWNEKAKGVFYGIDFAKNKGHFIRAALEGVAYSLKHNLETALDVGAKVKLLRATGGAANSKLWMQIKADITQIPIEVSKSDTTTTLGAAILAGVGVGIYKDFEEAVALTLTKGDSYQPNTENRFVYEEGYKKYKQLYENLKDMML